MTAFGVAALAGFKYGARVVVGRKPTPEVFLGPLSRSPDPLGTFSLVAHFRLRAGLAERAGDHFVECFPSCR